MLAPERPNQKKTNRRWPWISNPGQTPRIGAGQSHARPTVAWAARRSPANRRRRTLRKCRQRRDVAYAGTTTAEQQRIKNSNASAHQDHNPELASAYFAHGSTAITITPSSHTASLDHLPSSPLRTPTPPPPPLSTHHLLSLLLTNLSTLISLSIFFHTSFLPLPPPPSHPPIPTVPLPPPSSLSPSSLSSLLSPSLLPHPLSTLPPPPPLPSPLLFPPPSSPSPPPPPSLPPPPPPPPLPPPSPSLSPSPSSPP